MLKSTDHGNVRHTNHRQRASSATLLPCRDTQSAQADTAQSASRINPPKMLHAPRQTRRESSPERPAQYRRAPAASRACSDHEESPEIATSPLFRFFAVCVSSILPIETVDVFGTLTDLFRENQLRKFDINRRAERKSVWRTREHDDSAIDNVVALQQPPVALPSLCLSPHILVEQ